MIDAAHHETKGASARRGDRALATASRTRSCVGCGERVDARSGDLRRLVLGPEGDVAVDACGGARGRGVHVHPRPSCVARAAEKGVARSAKRRVTHIRVASAGLVSSKVALNRSALALALKAAETQRIEQLLATARRAGQLAFGPHAVAAARAADAQVQVIVACDGPDEAALAEVPAPFKTDAL